MVDEILSLLGSTWPQLIAAAVSGLVIYGWVIAANRVAGLRSFSKMSAFDFAMTVAIGSTIAATALGTAPLVHGLVAVGVLFAAQIVIALLRRDAAADHVVDNQPLLLMRGAEVLEPNLHRARLTRADLDAKLRAANVLRRADVRAVVLETTGDVSVLAGEGTLDTSLLAEVEGWNDG